jgi:hypothetical protein
MQLVMSDKQTTMSNDTLPSQVEKIVCLRNSRIAVTVLKKIYVDEARHWCHVAHDISARLSHWQCEDPTSRAASNLAQSREADDSSIMMLPLSDPE